MEIRKMKISDLRPADYNPRQDLKPGDRGTKRSSATLCRNNAECQGGNRNSDYKQGQGGVINAYHNKTN